MAFVTPSPKSPRNMEGEDVSRVLATKSSLFYRLHRRVLIYLLPVVYFSEWIFFVPEFHPKDHGLKHHCRGSSEIMARIGLKKNTLLSVNDYARI